MSKKKPVKGTFKVEGEPWKVVEQLTTLFWDYLHKQGWDVKGDWDYDNHKVTFTVHKIPE